MSYAIIDTHTGKTAAGLSYAECEAFREAHADQIGRFTYHDEPATNAPQPNATRDDH